jgi:hypothetical protein
VLSRRDKKIGSFVRIPRRCRAVLGQRRERLQCDHAGQFDGLSKLEKGFRELFLRSSEQRGPCDRQQNRCGNRGPDPVARSHRIRSNGQNAAAPGKINNLNPMLAPCA